jgi:hypothetical protein
MNLLNSEKKKILYDKDPIKPSLNKNIQNQRKEGKKKGNSPTCMPFLNDIHKNPQQTNEKAYNKKTPPSSLNH